VGLKTPCQSAGLWGVYLLQCADGTFYCGVTNDLDKRVNAHNAGKGARYTRGRLPVVVLVYTGPCFEKANALRVERQTKKMPRQRKATFLQSFHS